MVWELYPCSPNAYSIISVHAQMPHSDSAAAPKPPRNDKREEMPNGLIRATFHPFDWRCVGLWGFRTHGHWPNCHPGPGGSSQLLPRYMYPEAPSRLFTTQCLIFPHAAPLSSHFPKDARSFAAPPGCFTPKGVDGVACPHPEPGVVRRRLHNQLRCWNQLP